MGLLVFAVALTVGSNVLYHVSQKSIPGGAHPLMSLTVTYVVALVVTLVLFPFYPGGAPTWKSVRGLNWASVAVGIAIVGVEMGVLLAYRAGWRVSVGSTMVNAALAVLLIPIGIFYFGERLTAGNVMGILLCVGGLLLLL
jgi:drug/metabolite transporter (DMT)-like permease